MMKQGVKRLVVRKSVVWKGMSKRFSLIYNGKLMAEEHRRNQRQQRKPPPEQIVVHVSEDPDRQVLLPLEGRRAPLHNRVPRSPSPASYFLFY